MEDVEMAMDSPKDSSSANDASSLITSVQVHPLAIVHMADQYTRITCGGSPLDVTAPVTGLLFGASGPGPAGTAGPGPRQQTAAATTSCWQVLDADDIPIDAAAQQQRQQQVELHTAVFAQHQVLGWYRVVARKSENHGNAENPSLIRESDLQVTQQLAASTTSGQPFFFALLQVPNADNGDDKKQDDGDQKPKSIPDDTKEKSVDESAMSLEHNDQDEDDELFFQLYYYQEQPGGGGILIGLENQKSSSEQQDSSNKSKTDDTSKQQEQFWTLETSIAERLAVERVMREEEQQHHAHRGGGGATKSSKHVVACQRIQHSVVAIAERWSVIEQYLTDTAEGRVPFHPVLVRHIQALVLELGPIAAATSNSGPAQPEQLQEVSVNTMSGLDANDVVSQLAVLAKTVDAVQSYVDKFRVVHEAGHSASHGPSSSPFLGSAFMGSAAPTAAMMPLPAGDPTASATSTGGGNTGAGGRLTAGRRS